jgi:hypothetical protein
MYGFGKDQNYATCIRIQCPGYRHKVRKLESLRRLPRTETIEEGGVGTGLHGLAVVPLDADYRHDARKLERAPYEKATAQTLSAAKDS